MIEKTSKEYRKNGIYLHSGSKTCFVGVNKKINNQLKVFGEYFDVREVVIEKETTNFLKSVLWRMPFGSFGREYKSALMEIVSEKEPDFIYFRHQSVDRRFLAFIKSLRTSYPMAKIIDEIPTYPYSKELIQSKDMWPFFFKDIVYRKKLAKYLDRIVTFSNDEEIWGVKTIMTQNGICTENLCEAQPDNNCKDINIIAVAQFQPSHGYERVIRGLGAYYKDVIPDRLVYLHLVGEGVELSKYQKLVDKNNIGQYVKFYGFKRGEELEELYQGKDISLSVFGLYKRGIETISSLKAAESLAKGIPIVTAGDEKALYEGNSEFGLMFDNDDSVVDINEIVKWYLELLRKYGSKEELSGMIRKTTTERVNMRVVLNPIIEWIEQEG